MKKYIATVLLITLLFVLPSCKQELNVESLNIPILDNMKLETTNEANIEDQNVVSSTYSISNSSADTFLYDYEKELNDAGWETVNDLKPRGLVVEKNNNQVTVVVYEQNNKLLADVIPTPKPEEKE